MTTLLLQDFRDLLNFFSIFIMKVYQGTLKHDRTVGKKIFIIQFALFSSEMLFVQVSNFLTKKFVGVSDSLRDCLLEVTLDSQKLLLARHACTMITIKFSHSFC
jgi:hypothetical protein